MIGWKPSISLIKSPPPPIHSDVTLGWAETMASHTQRHTHISCLPVGYVLPTLASFRVEIECWTRIWSSWWDQTLASPHTPSGHSNHCAMQGRSGKLGKADIVHEYGDTLHGIGTLGPPVHFQVDNKITPVQAPIHRIPVAKRNKEKTAKDRYVAEDILKRVNEPTPWCSNELIDWLYQSFTAHQHQKGHTVPKQVSPLDDDDYITHTTEKKMLRFYSLRTARSKNCTVWEHSLSGQAWTKYPSRPDTQGAPRGGCSLHPSNELIRESPKKFRVCIKLESDHQQSNPKADIPHATAEWAASQTVQCEVLLHHWCQRGISTHPIRWGIVHDDDDAYVLWPLSLATTPFGDYQHTKLIDWLYRSFKAHQHQNGQTVP